VDRWLFIWQLSFGHCVVCPSSTYGFCLLFWNLKICLIELHIYFILMKNSKVHKVWMLIIKKGISTNRYVHSVWINRNKIERITEYLYLIQCLLVQDAPFNILAFERWQTINKKNCYSQFKMFLIFFFIPNYRVKNRFKDISQNIYNCCIDQSTFLISDIYCEDHLLN
jgi:hypothetical protein